MTIKDWTLRIESLSRSRESLHKTLAFHIRTIEHFREADEPSRSWTVLK